MKTTIDSAGRVAIPSEIRREANLTPGTEVEVRYRDGRIEIEPASVQVRLVKEGRWLVAVPRVEVAPLTVETVEDIREQLWREREEEAS